MLSFVVFAISICLAVQKSPTIEEFLAEPIPEYAKKLTGKALVDYVNAKQPFFKAEYSPSAQKSLKTRLMDTKYKGMSPTRYIKSYSSSTDNIPESFDAREKWPSCPSISYIRDQSACKSSWAVSAAEIMSDRSCIRSMGKTKVHLSDADILACCGHSCGDGCEGGYVHYAIDYASHAGICSGGRFGEKGVCKPYSLYPCGEHKGQPFFGPCPEKRFPTPKCRRKCQLKYPRSYGNDKVYAEHSYFLPYNTTAIMEDIMTNGPVVGIIALYEDFLYYKEGVYVHTAGELQGVQAMKIIGWGNDNGTLYWLIANSWNTDWGQNGYCRFLRGVNHCLIEYEMIGAVMKD